MSADLCSSADVFERSRTWFLGLESGNHVSIECEMRRLVGLWLCEKISEKESFEFSQIAGNLARRIAALPDKAGILQIDSKLWLLSHRILEMCGEGVPSLGELCRTISRELVGRGTYSGYEGEAVILGRLGLLPPPIVGRMIDLDSNRIVRGTVSELRAVADDIFASTLFGGRRLQSPRYPSLTSMAMAISSRPASSSLRFGPYTNDSTARAAMTIAASPLSAARRTAFPQHLYILYYCAKPARNTLWQYLQHLLD